MNIRPMVRPMVRAMTRGLVPGSSFDPLSLAPIAYFDRSDLSTMFKDATGTDPVTASVDPIGLALDKSQGLVLGSEAITNGDFSAGSTGWTTGGAAMIVGGVADTANGGYWDQSQSPTAGKIYRVAFSVVRYASGSVRPFFIGGTTVGGNAVTATGDYVQYIFAESGNSTLRFSTGSGSDLAIDNISVKELPGNHAPQSVTSLKPTLDITGGLYSAVFDADDEMTLSLPTAPAAATVVIAKSTGTEISYPVDLSGGSYTMSETDYGLMILDYELSAQQQTDITAFFDAKAGV